MLAERVEREETKTPTTAGTRYSRYSILDTVDTGSQTQAWLAKGGGKKKAKDEIALYSDPICREAADPTPIAPPSPPEQIMRPRPKEDPFHSAAG